MGNLIFDPLGLGEELQQFFEVMDKFFRSLVAGIPSEYLLEELIKRGELDDQEMKVVEREDKNE